MQDRVTWFLKKHPSWVSWRTQRWLQFVVPFHLQTWRIVSFTTMSWFQEWCTPALHTSVPPQQLTTSFVGRIAEIIWVGTEIPEFLYQGMHLMPNLLQPCCCSQEVSDSSIPNQYWHHYRRYCTACSPHQPQVRIVSQLSVAHCALCILSTALISSFPFKW